MANNGVHSAVWNSGHRSQYLGVQRVNILDQLTSKRLTYNYKGKEQLADKKKKKALLIGGMLYFHHDQNVSDFWYHPQVPERDNTHKKKSFKFVFPLHFAANLHFLNTNQFF